METSVKTPPHHLPLISLCKIIMPKFNTSEWSNLGEEWGRKGRF